MNPVVEYLKTAKPEEVQEAVNYLLTPFKKFEVTSFKSLFEKYEANTAELMTLREAEAKRVEAQKLAEAEKVAQAERKVVAETLTKAGIKTADGKDLDENSALVKAYISLNEEGRKQLVAEHICTKTLGSEGHAEAKPAVKPMSESIANFYPSPMK